MRNLLHKLLLSSLFIILLPMALAILWTSNTLSTLLERRFAEKSKAQAERVQVLLNEKQEIATGLASWIAEMPGVKDTLKRKDREGLFQLLLPLVGSIELDFIEILDNEGGIFLRVHDPSRYGDRPVLSKDIQGLLQGMRDLPNYGVEKRDGNVYLRAAESIEGDGILGVVSTGYALKRDLLKEMERIADGQVVIAVKDKFYSTIEARGLVKKASTPESENSKEREVRWHREDPSPSLEIRLPLETLRGQEGSISLFFPSHEMIAAIGTLQKTLLLVALMGMVLALSVSWILSRRLTQPLKELVVGTEQVAAGNYAAAVSTESKDEIGTLATSFNRMLEELRKSKAEVESYRQELERKFAERGKELAETEKKRAAMAHMVAHDLKNPLLGIKKTLERLEQTPPEINGEQRKSILQDLLSASDLVIGMVNEMLDLYRSDFGELPLSLSRFRIEEPIQTSLRILGPELEEKKLQVLSRSEPPHISVVADKRRVTRLLINLLSNAIKFSANHGRVYVSTVRLEAGGRSGAGILLRVEDEGMGIPEEELPRIFDRFYPVPRNVPDASAGMNPDPRLSEEQKRQRSGTSRIGVNVLDLPEGQRPKATDVSPGYGVYSRDQGKVETGTGLGLPYCKLVAEAHGGKIFAESRSGGGFSVSVILPASAEEGQEAYGT